MLIIIINDDNVNNNVNFNNYNDNDDNIRNNNNIKNKLYYYVIIPILIFLQPNILLCITQYQYINDNQTNNQHWQYEHHNQHIQK